MAFFVEFSSDQNVFQILFQNCQKFEIVGLLLFKQFHLVFVEDNFMVRVYSEHVFLMNFEFFVDFDFDVPQDF